MSFFSVLRNSCLVGVLVVGAVGCATEPAKPAVTPAQAAIAALSPSQKAERLLGLLHADKLSVPVYMQVKQTFDQLFLEAKAPESKRAVLERYQGKANLVIDKTVGWNALKPEYVKFFTTTYTDAELAKLIEFYEAPTGQKWSKQMPMPLMNMQLIQMKQGQFGPQLDTLIQDMAKELNFKLK